MGKKRAMAKRDGQLVPGPFELKATGLVVKGKPTAKQWDQAGGMLCQAHGALQWWIGDWLLYGEGKPEWGDKYAEACERFGREEQTLKNYKWVASEVQLSVRTDNLSWEHHKLVAPFTTSKQKRLLRKAEKEGWSVAELRKEIRTSLPTEDIPLPDGQYNLIYADPPWRYEHSKTDSRKIENQYPTMELDDICDLDVADVAAEDCVLFMWATSPKLAESIQVIKAWGFNYRTCMTWVKDRIGMGYYARQRHELLLIATQGTPHPPSEKDRPDSVVEAPRQEHSKKPERFYEIIETMYPKAEKVELFCRQPRQGWSVWGNEV